MEIVFEDVKPNTLDFISCGVYEDWPDTRSVTGYQPIRDRYFLIRSVPVTYIIVEGDDKATENTEPKQIYPVEPGVCIIQSYRLERVKYALWECRENGVQHGLSDTSKQPIRTRYLSRSRDWLLAKQEPVVPSIGRFLDDSSDCM